MVTMALWLVMLTMVTANGHQRLIVFSLLENACIAPFPFHRQISTFRDARNQTKPKHTTL